MFEIILNIADAEKKGKAVFILFNFVQWCFIY